MLARRLLSGGWWCAVLFVALGLAFVNRTGVEEDESMFAAPLYRDWCFFAIPMGHGRVPIMHMSYVGALKTWLYTPVAMVWGPSAAMLRVPALILGGLTILLFWKLLDSMAGRRAAWAGCLLLSTDAVFLLTSVFDWGPVALQHLLMVTVLLCSVRWWQTNRDAWLFGAAFCTGLAFWDKAVFVWMFSGLAAGALLFWRGIGKRFTWRRVGLAAAGLCLGAAPLIYYNVSSGFLTLRSNARVTPGHFAERFGILRATWSGSALFGYMVHETSERPNAAQGAVERASFLTHDLVGDRRRGYLEAALLASALLLPLLWRTAAWRIAMFALIAAAVGWVAMVLLDGGGSAHHAVLLWPIPALFAGVCLAEASKKVRFGRWVLAAVVALVAGANLLVVNQYWFDFVRNGAAGSWTDAIYPLASTVREARAAQVALVDWGAQDPLSFLNRATPAERVVADPFMPEGEPAAQRQADMELLRDRGTIWVSHAAGSEVSQGVNDRLLRTAHGQGLEQTEVKTICDRNGRAIFQTFRFAASR